MNNIKLERTRKDLTHLSGLIYFSDLINRLNLVNRLGSILPQAKVIRRLRPKEKFLTGIFGFIAGADCIDDLDNLRRDRLFSELTKDGTAPSTMRQFMGDFRLKFFERLQDLLPVIASELRQKMFPGSDKIIITMDATPHKQYGEYMEGVDWCYNKEKGYISQNAFDEKGFCYGWNLMPGNTHSHRGAVEMIERIFSKLPDYKNRYFRADSAYGSHKVYNSLLNLGVHFGICLSKTVWGPLLDRNEFKMKWTKTRLRFFESNKCQIASTLYAPKHLRGRGFLRVVFIRAKKKVIKSEDKRHYDYYAIITDMTEKEMSSEDVIRFYRGRSNAENFIKDLKYGMDFKHFPCQSMTKNRTWGFMGIFAYNLMRFASFSIDRRGCYLKRVRTNLVYIASELRRGQRNIILRFSNNTNQEVTRFLEKLHLKFCPGFYRSSWRGGPPPQ